MNQSHLLLAKVVRQVGNHDLVLAGDAVFRRTTLLARLVRLGLAGLGRIGIDGTLLTDSARERLVGRGRQTGSLAWHIGWARAIGRGLSLAIGLLRLSHISWCTNSMALLLTHASATSGTTSTTAATATSGVAALLALSALGSFGSSRLGLASELHRNLAIEDALAVQLADGTLGFGGGRNIDEGVADGAGGARVGWDGCGLTEHMKSVSSVRLK